MKPKSRRLLVIGASVMVLTSPSPTRGDSSAAIRTDGEQIARCITAGDLAKAIHVAELATSHTSARYVRSTNVVCHDVDW